MVRDGVLRCLLPGVYCRWQDAATPEVRILAASSWAPDAVLTGRAAARLSFWPTLAVPVVTLCSIHNRNSRSGFTVSRQGFDPEVTTWRGPCRITVPALTALDLVPELGGDAIDRVLRLRLAGLDDMAEALRLTAGRPGNKERRRMLTDSRDEPWSGAEREAHRLLRTAGLTGWKANLPVTCGEALYFLDVAFEALKLGIEIDGREVHRAENVRQFHHDRRKWTVLYNEGWALLHFGPEHISGDPDWFVASVQRAQLLRQRRLG